MEVWPGGPYPLGATFDGMGTNFALFSEVADGVELCLFDNDGQRAAHHDDRARLAGLALSTSRGSGPASATATGSTGRTSPSTATDAIRPSC